MAKDKIETRGTKGKYTNDIQPLVLAVLSQSTKGELMLTANVLLKKLNMVNKNYALGRRNVPMLSELTEVNKEVIYDFYNTTNSNLVSALESSLKRLRSRRLIMWEKVIGVAKVNQYNKNELGEIVIDIDDNTKDKATVNTNTEYRQATLEEKQIILNIEKTVLARMGYKDAQSVFLAGMWAEYKKRVVALVRKEINVKYHFEAYVLTYNHDDVVEALKEDLGKELYIDIAKRLNNTVQTSVKENAITKHNNAIEKKATIEEMSDVLGMYTDKELKAKGVKGYKIRKEDIFRAKDAFVEDTVKLSDTLINKNATDLTGELKKEIVKTANIEEVVNDEIPF